MNTLTTLTRTAALVLALAAGIGLAANPGAAAKRQKVYVNKGAETYGDFRSPAGPRRMIIRERGEPPHWGYIGPHYQSRFGPGYHTNGPGIGIEK